MKGITPVNSQKGLEVALSKLKGFENPKLELEQVSTPSSIAAKLLWQAYMQGSIEGNTVADYGAGTGILGIGCALLGANKVLLIESDSDALIIAKGNLGLIENNIANQIESLNIDVSGMETETDTVVMNPPFGAARNNRNADRTFLLKAFNNSNHVYSLHNAGSENFLKKFSEDSGFSFRIISREKLTIGKSFAHHKKIKADIDVLLCAFSRIS